jgi:hypothetical protein
MGTELATIYTSGPSEYTGLLAGTLDFTDWPCVPTTTCPTVSGGTSTPITAPVAAVAYFEIQFMLANNFWGVNMNFGNNPNGTEIRQGIAHMIDKTSFTTNEANLTGAGVPIDNPLSPNIGGNLPGANPCGWDQNYTQTGSNCVVGAPGGTAYHLATATGADGYPWLQAPGSPDLNAAAQHFVNAGIATGCYQVGNSGTTGSCATSTSSVLSGINASATVPGHVPTFFVRKDDPSRLDLGDSLSAQICYIFTGMYTQPCAYLNVVPGPITAFPGFQTNPTAINLNWWIYTADYIGGTFFDSSLYDNYNSRFVDSFNCTGEPGCSSLATPFPLAQSNGGPCSNAAVPTASAADYMYLCNSNYDSMSTQMEFAPCLTATGDPAPGQTNNGPGADCPSTTQLSAISAGVQAENIYGEGAYTIPIYTENDQFGYLNNGWIRAINSASTGLPGFFTWLDAYNPTPTRANTIRQGFAESTKSLSPYIASTPSDFDILHNIYDSLYAANPLSPTQLMNWMTISTQPKPNSQLTYTPPTGTTTTYRFTLIPGLTFQDGSPVTAFDVAFSYLSLLGTGAFQSGGASPINGITILGPHQFDFNLNSQGPFTLTGITGLTIMPARYWVLPSSCLVFGTCIDTATFPAQYVLSGTPLAVACGPVGCGSVAAINLQWDPTKITATYDPLKNGMLVGSGAWQCGSGSGLGGPGCSSTGAQNLGPGGSYTLTAYPGYAHSAYNLALWIWASQGSAAGPSLLTYSAVRLCFNAVSVPIGTSAGCAHWQSGIGGSGGTVAPGTAGTALSSDPRLVYTGPAPVLSVSTTSGSTNATVASGDFPGVVPGMIVTGTGIASGTTVVSVSGNTLTLSVAATATGTVTLSFFGAGDTIVYNVNGGTTYTTGDTVIGCVATATCTSTTPIVGTPLNSDPLLKYYDNPGITPSGVWANGKSVVYDTNSLGYYAWGEVSSLPNSNSAGLFITFATGITIPPPPPATGTNVGSCPPVGVAGVTSAGCWAYAISTPVGIVALRLSYNWLNPYNWASSPPLGIGAFSPVLYQPNSNVPLNPASVAGCTNPFSATSLTSGGYDC